MQAILTDVFHVINCEFARDDWFFAFFTSFRKDSQCCPKQSAFLVPILIEVLLTVQSVPRKKGDANEAWSF